MADYVQSLMQQALAEYPFIAQHNPNVVLGKGDGYAETYPIGETGKPLGNGKFSRPQALPIIKLGIEIYLVKCCTETLLQTKHEKNYLNL